MGGMHTDPAIPRHVHGFLREDRHSFCDSQDGERTKTSLLIQNIFHTIVQPSSRVDRGGPVLSAAAVPWNRSALSQEGTRGCCG